MPFGPQLTIICINFNQGKYIHDCLDSIRKQSFKNWELIIIDDKSTDDSVQLIQDYINAHNFPCRLIINKENAGICKNLNNGLALAKGEYFSFIAADDWGDLNRFETMINILEDANDKVAVVYSDCEMVDEKKSLLNTSYLKFFRPDLSTAPQGEVFETLLSGNFVPAMATVIKKSVLLEIGGFDEDLKFEDYDVWLRIAKKYQFLYDPNSLCYYRILTNSLIRSIGYKKYENLISIYLKHFEKNNTNTYELIKHQILACCEFLYYTGSPNFNLITKNCISLVGTNSKIDTLLLFNRLGIRGSVFKKVSNFLHGRKSQEK